MTRYLIDAYDLGRNTKGIHRVLSSLIPELVAQHDDLVVATTAAGRKHLAGLRVDIVEVPVMRKSRWEQQGLPSAAQRAGAAATYSHREAGALWGPPLVLHVPEDPEVRWARDPAVDATDRARRAYSRAVMGRSLRRAAVVAASVDVIADQLAARYEVEVATIPLGVDVGMFRPAEHPREDHVFHLGSSDPRDRTVAVVEAYAETASRTTLPQLVIAGSLGDDVGSDVQSAVRRLGLPGSVELRGRVSDEELVSLYGHALAVMQPASDEGFGLQPLEALACGAVVIAADAPAVREVVGAAGLLVGGGAPALSAELLRVTAVKSCRDALRVTARTRALNLDWRRSAHAVIDALALAVR